MNFINTIMTNTIKILSPSQIKLTWYNKSVVLNKVKSTRNLKTWYKFNNEYYA